MAWYDDWTAGLTAVGGALALMVGGLVNQLMKARRTLAQHNSEIKVEKSDTKAASWLTDSLIQRAEKAEQERDATMRAAKELVGQRMIDVERLARQEERLKNAETMAKLCEERAKRAEHRAAIAEEHMRTQAEQMLVMSMNIDRLTTKLAQYDKEAAHLLTPDAKRQPMLTVEPVLDLHVQENTDDSKDV